MERVLKMMRSGVEGFKSGHKARHGVKHPSVPCANPWNGAMLPNGN